jgi:hypothetical protein
LRLFKRDEVDDRDGDGVGDRDDGAGRAEIKSASRSVPTTEEDL